MSNKIEYFLSIVTGSVSALVMSTQFSEIATKSFTAIVTGFLGAMAGLTAKMLFNKIRSKILKKDDKS